MEGGVSTIPTALILVWCTSSAGSSPFFISSFLHTFLSLDPRDFAPLAEIARQD